MNESPAWRTDYYQRKFKISEPEKRPEAVQAVVRKYIEGLQWTLYYYFKGLASWSWFYPYHYTPLVIDLIDLTSLNMTFDFARGQPFLPFQQLMAVLPPQSAQLVPKALRVLMKDVSHFDSLSSLRGAVNARGCSLAFREPRQSLSSTRKYSTLTLKERRTTGKALSSSPLSKKKGLFSFLSSSHLRNGNITISVAC